MSPTTAATTSTSSPVRVHALDVLRGVAILLVLFHHPGAPPWSAGVLTPVTEALRHVGWSGVDLFFVLSGYLVGGQLLLQQRTRGTIDVPRFLLRRVLKIWPSYFAFLAVVFVELVCVEPVTTPAVAVQRLLPNLLHVQNYFPVVTPRIPTWSLAVEEHFYLLLPLALLAAARVDRTGALGRPVLPLGVLGVAIVCFALRCRAVLHGENPGFVVLKTHLRIDSLLFGVWLAHVSAFHGAWLAKRMRPWLWRGVGLALVSPMLFFRHDRGPFGVTIGVTSLYLGWGAILLAQVAPTSTPREPGSLSRALAAVGRQSYPMYLWFLDATIWFRAVGYADFLDRRFAAAGMDGELGRAVWWMLVQLTFILLVFAVGRAASVLVERPVLAWRDRRFPSAPPARYAAAPARDTVVMR